MKILFNFIYFVKDGGKDESLESQATWDGTNLDAQK